VADAEAKASSTHIYDFGYILLQAETGA
jgi:hypothetical protein